MKEGFENIVKFEFDNVFRNPYITHYRILLAQQINIFDRTYCNAQFLRDPLIQEDNPVFFRCTFYPLAPPAVGVPTFILLEVNPFKDFPSTAYTETQLQNNLIWLYL
jgi:hypothetical protein